MKKYIFSFVLILTAVSCSNNNKQANLYLTNIQSLSENGYYEDALLKIDSIQILFPKAFDEIKKGIAYKQEVRKAMNEKQIADCDSLIAINSPKIDSLKKFFVLSQNKEYQDKGTYIPKSINSNTLTSTLLRSGVNDDGSMYIESVYLGGQLHNTIRINSKDKQFAESLPVKDDGLNFRFSNLGKQYEVIKVTPIHDNGLAKFIYSTPEQPLTVVLKGKHTTSFPLSNIQKKAIKDSYLLSTLLVKQDSLLTAKDKAQVLINYIDSKEAKNDSINAINSKN